MRGTPVATCDEGIAGMSSLRVVGGILGASMLVLAWSITNEMSAGLDHGALGRRSSAAVSGVRPQEHSTRGNSFIDRYGNEVERAISDYRIDYRGDLYERHSPQTAMPRLLQPEA